MKSKRNVSDKRNRNIAVNGRVAELFCNARRKCYKLGYIEQASVAAAVDEIGKFQYAGRVLGRLGVSSRLCTVVAMPEAGAVHRRIIAEGVAVATRRRNHLKGGIRYCCERAEPAAALKRLAEPAIS